MSRGGVERQRCPLGYAYKAPDTPHPDYRMTGTNARAGGGRFLSRNARCAYAYLLLRQDVVTSLKLEEHENRPLPAPGHSENAGIVHDRRPHAVTQPHMMAQQR